MSNALLKVKDVPVFYLPGMYYPINKADRATGFLIPIYGASTIKGQTLKNAFFWAIDRSRDATLYADYFSKTGYGYGGEYRYIQSPTSAGTVQTYVQREHDATYEQPDGTDNLQAGIDSYTDHRQHDPGAAQPPALSGQRQLFFEPGRAAALCAAEHLSPRPSATRSYGVNLQGNWGANTVSGTVERNELFSGDGHRQLERDGRCRASPTAVPRKNSGSCRSTSRLSAEIRDAQSAPTATTASSTIAA